MGGLKIPFWKRHHPISGSRKSKRLSCGGEQAVGILNDDFGESDDNLSFRSISERESSPVSMAVSPVGSIGGDTDGDDSAENALLRGSPVTVDPSRYLVQVETKQCGRRLRFGRPFALAVRRLIDA